jgi:hypothetical protein
MSPQTNGAANGTSYKFEGWLGKDKSSAKGFVCGADAFI